SVGASWARERGQLVDAERGTRAQQVIAPALPDVGRLASTTLLRSDVESSADASSATLSLRCRAAWSRCTPLHPYSRCSTCTSSSTDRSLRSCSVRRTPHRRHKRCGPAGSHLLARGCSERPQATP